MPELLLLADDLTGACDSASPFAGTGVPTWVALTPRLGPLPDSAGSASVLALDSETRDLSPAEAEVRLESVLPLMARVPRPFLKVDSTLRGHVGATLSRLLPLLRHPVALFAPAFPAHGRVVSGGVLRVGDSGPTVDLLGYLAGCGAEVTRVSREALASGALEAALASEPRPTVLVPDALCDADLDLIAQALVSAEGRVLPVGSGGLAAALARCLHGEPRPPEVAPCRRALVAAGSEHPVTQAQIEACRREGWPWATWEGDRTPLPEAGGGVLGLSPGRDSRSEGPRGAGGPEGGPLLERFGAWAARAALEWRPDALVLTGGATARAVLRALVDLGDEGGRGAASGLRVRGDLLPGIPASILVGGPMSGIVVVTKSGGFGRTETLLELMGWLRRGAPPGSGQS